MAGIKESFSKGFTTINMKTSSFIEENKLKTTISTRESEIAQLREQLADTVYENKDNFSMDMVRDIITAIDEKYAAIEVAKQEIAGLAEKEREVLGTPAPAPAQTPVAAPKAETDSKIFCSQCGAPNPVGHKFCEKCGNKLA